MKFDFIHQNFVQSLTICILLLIIYWGKMSFLAADLNPVNIPVGLMPIGESLFSFFSKQPHLSILILCPLLLFNGLYFSRVVIRGIIFKNSTHTTSTLYIIFSMFICDPAVSLLAQIIATILLIAIERLTRIKKLINCSSYFFTASFCIALASLIALQSLIFYIAAISVLLIYQRFNFKELISSIIGLATPLFLYSYFFWATNEDFDILYYYITNHNTLQISPIYEILDTIPILKIVKYSTLSILIIYALIIFISNAKQLRTRSRNSHIFMIIWMICAASAVILYWNIATLFAPLIFLTVSLLTVVVFQYNKKITITNTLYLVLISLSLLSNLINL